MSSAFISEAELTADEIVEAAELGTVELADGRVFEYWRHRKGAAWFRVVDGSERPQTSDQATFAAARALRKSAENKVGTCQL